MCGRIYTPEQIDFLRQHITGKRHMELTVMFNKRFGEDRTVQQITAACKNRKFCNNLDTRFKRGHIPYNKGAKGICLGGEKTQFKKGHRPLNYRPIGSERVNVDGYIEVKVADPNKWKSKHVFNWEELHGSVPKGHAIVFGDGNKQNLSPDNLILVSRGELAVMNKRGLIGGSADFTKAGQIVANIYMAAKKRKRGS